MKKWLFILVPSVVLAAEQPKLDSGDTAWMLISTALVMLMTLPGLAIFYGGLSKKKDSLNTIGMSFIAYLIVSVIWFCMVIA